MNDEFLRQIPPEDQPISDALQSVAETLQVNPHFQSSLEASLKQHHPVNKGVEQSTHIKILPAIGWAILALGALLILNWAVRSLAPDRQPAANGTPEPDASFESDATMGNLCAGQLAVAHGFSVFLSNPDKNGSLTLGERNDIGELRNFSWSPDGQQLALVGNTRGSGNLYLVDSVDYSLQPVLAHSEFGYLTGVTWSHDGKQLLTWQIDNNTRMYFVNSDGAGVTVLDIPQHFSETPRFSPDGQSILFFGADDSSSGLFEVKLDGSPARLISKFVENESSFAWSADGTRLAYIEKDRDTGEARLVIEGGGAREVVATLPIPKGSGSSLPNSANLSWSPDGTRLVFELGRNASDHVVYLANADGSGLVPLAESAHAPAISTNGKCLAYMSGKQVFLLDLSASSPSPVLLAELPTGRGMSDLQLDKLGWGAGTTSAPEIQTRNEATPTPSGSAYDWRGIKLYLNSTLPDAPTEAGLYQVQPEQPATPDLARALAAQFGMNGELYETPSELGNSDVPNYLVVDGNQRLFVRSNLYYSYYPDYTRWATGNVFGQIPEGASAEAQISDFMRLHGLDFAYKVVFSEFYIGYYALPLTPDGFPVQHQHFNSVGLLFRFDKEGIIGVEANLADYTPIEHLGIITADAAFQKLLNPNTANGILEGMHSSSPPVDVWYRPRPENQTVTVWGWVSSVRSLEGGSPLVTLDGYRATGHLAGLSESMPNTFVEATGQFQNIDGIKTFVIETWQVYDGYEDGLQGTIQREGDQVTVTTLDRSVLVLPDAPGDLPLPLENAFVLGVAQGDVFEWKSIDTRMQIGGGGGGGGGLGFYKPNLTGTPVPLPPVEGPQETSTGTGDYDVQEGDTLSTIAEAYGTTVDELMQANGFTEATIFIGQSLVIPGISSGSSLIGQKIEAQRGVFMVEIYRQPDGSLQPVYSFLTPPTNRYNYFLLSGDGLGELEKYHNRPIDIWGTIESAGDGSAMVVHVDRYEIPFPDLQFQILRGTQEQTMLEDQAITLFTTTDRQTYVQFSLEGNVSDFIVGNPGDDVLLEAMAIPGETFGGYPTLRVYSSGLAISPKNGQPMDMQVTADQPSVIDGLTPDKQYATSDLSVTIEKVELVYFTPNKRYALPDPAAGPVYIQPAWRFQGHFWDGSEFEILIQALKDEFLLPEVDTVDPPG